MIDSLYSAVITWNDLRLISRQKWARVISVGDQGVNGIAVGANSCPSDTSVFIFHVLWLGLSNCSLLDRMVVGLVSIFNEESDVLDSIAVQVQVSVDRTSGV